MTKRNKKLAIAKTTVRALSMDELHHAGGAGTVLGCAATQNLCGRDVSYGIPCVRTQVGCPTITGGP